MAFDRNTIAAFVLAILVLLGWEFFLSPKVTPKPPVTAEQTEAPAMPAAPPATPIGETPAAPAVEAPTPAERTGAPEQRIRIATPNLHGSLTLTGGRLDDITLVNYRESLDSKSPEIVLLSPTVAPKPYYAEMGWITGDAGVAVPTPSTTWSTENAEAGLTEKAPVVLTWDNGQGLTFKRTISVDQDYLFTVEQTVENTGEKPVTLYPYGLIARLDGVSHTTTYILHEGPIGVFNNTLKEVDYDEVKKDKREQVESTGGWIGITDKYWLAAIAFDQNLKVTASFNHAMSGERDRYQTDMRADAVTVAPGETKSVKGYIFAGAKELQVLDNYTDNVGIARLDLAIDFGWFFYLTKPFFIALRWLHGELGNFGLAIIVFSTFVRLLMFPIANRQYITMNNMKRLQPDLKRLQEKHKNDRAKLNQEMMELYKREKINPLAGCLPILIQIPVFFALYKVLFVSIEMRHAPFYGWIHDLSAADPTGVLNLFGLLPYTVPALLAFLNIGAWPLIYGVTMYFQQKLMPQQGDPTTQKIMMYMPLIFTFVLASMPAGLVIYWAWSNLLGILQQWILLRRAGIKGLSQPAPDLEKGRKLFAQRCEFVLGVAAVEQIPEGDVPEITFAGRSNVGKSSLINALTGQKTLARTSDTPGRTQEINFFDLGGRLMITDLPGYGFAKAPKDKVAAWTDVIKQYLKGRPNLRRALVLVDARHGLKDTDRDIMKLMDKSAVNYQIVLTKADKVKPKELAAVQAAILKELAEHVAAHPEILVTSAYDGFGIPELRAALSELALPE